MADYRSGIRTRSGARTDVATDQGLRSYMLGIYNYMSLGIAVTALIVLATNLPAIRPVANVLAFPAFFAILGLGWFGPRLVFNGSVTRAHVVYWAYVAAWGLGIAPIVNRYLGVNPSMVFTAFVSAAATFGAMSLWGYTSKRDLTGMAAIAGMALIGLLIASLVNFGLAVFVTGITGTAILISTLISAGFVLFVSLITAWETQAIKEMYVEADEQGTAAKKSIFGAFALYGSFVSIFVNILQILGFMSSSE
jgi:uncharacterized protein